MQNEKKISKRAAALFIVSFAMFMAACGAKERNSFVSGTVVTFGSGKQHFFEVAAEDGKNYGFVISEDTALVWEDTSAFSVWENREYDEWDVFGCGMEVTVAFEEEAESADDYVDQCVEGWFYAGKVTVTAVDEDYFAVSAKPVIYLYPETKTKVSVTLDYDGMLTCTYPAYDKGWKVTAYPDGTLVDEDGRTYTYLYWEGITAAEYDFSQGFCVAGKDTAAFLEKALDSLGLTRKEANECIVYWLPLMQENPYNLISFQKSAYTEHAKLTIAPKPDTVLRVFMAWKPLDRSVEIPEQTLTAPERSGFTVVEWGGAKVK